MTLRSAALLPLLFLPFPVGLSAAAAGSDAPAISLPSGVNIHLQEKLEDDLGENGLTYRFRFVMPDLAKRVPATSGSATDFFADGEGEGDGPRAPIDVDTEAANDEASADGDYIDDGMVSEEDLHLAPVISVPGAEEEADAAIDSSLSGSSPTGNEGDDRLPPAPDVLLKDPVHDDIVWICENLALPEALKSSRRPQQIVISLADRESVFGTYDPDVLQIFESFTLPKDRDSCEWRPW
ncbi:DUF6497 family protein [Paracoccus aminophilus]|uniref:Uncharacterized protein n=1 Tax=Paracoccus aminophilus JCM 7686 TaxID=1367847 RepID=S5XUV5_PARAH|nr:DUF6497 family protein [Paracoccus aminophilus]AGT09007.1 hypothetical protein JCM7686_1906 [Paracoccus aminophilus JCM 7686]